MKIINEIYINGEFRHPHGQEVMDLISPANKKVIGRVTLADEEDTREAIAAARAAFLTFSKTSVQERREMLQRLYDAAISRLDDLVLAAVEELGSPIARTTFRTRIYLENFLVMRDMLNEVQFEKTIGTTTVQLVPSGVVGFISPWNANYLYICLKFAAVIASGCTAVMKPSEQSAIQTQLLTACIAEAGIPPGVLNIVTGRGETVGAELSRNPDVAVISFTGSTEVGKIIYRNAAETMKRLKLELGGKSPNIILDDADFGAAIPLAINSAFANTGQSCIAGTRLLVPEHRLEEVKQLLKATVDQIKVGDPAKEDTQMGPVISQAQYDRIQHYIRTGIREGATLLIGGEGSPEGLEEGYFIKPTVFYNVTNEMTIAREEIFGPVLCVITYKTEEEAIAIANDSIYGLMAYISSTDPERARRVSERLIAGGVLINKVIPDELRAPLGGFKQSGIGRELGVYGIEELLETRAVYA